MVRLFDNLGTRLQILAVLDDGDAAAAGPGNRFYLGVM